MPILVFDLQQKDSIRMAVSGEKIGTIVRNSCLSTKINPYLKKYIMSNTDIFDKMNQDMDKSIDHVMHEFASLHTGKLKLQW